MKLYEKRLRKRANYNSQRINSIKSYRYTIQTVKSTDTNMLTPTIRKFHLQQLQSCTSEAGRIRERHLETINFKQPIYCINLLTSAINESSLHKQVLNIVNDHFNYWVHTSRHLSHGITSSIGGRD